MSAVTVQCPSCQARFHLAQERIPEKGARVRCSRCEHRFYVTATGDVSESKPRKGKEVADTDERSTSQSSSQSGSTSGSVSGASSAKPLVLLADEASQPRGRKLSREAKTTAMDALDVLLEPASPKPPRPRTLGAVAPREDADLDDPQFLFDETSSSAELPYTPGAPDEAPVELPGSGEQEEPSSEAFGDAPGHARSSRTPDADVTPQAPTEPLPEQAPADSPWLSGDDEAIPDIRAQRDELVAQHAPAVLSGPPDGFEISGNETPTAASEHAGSARAASGSHAKAVRPAVREASESPAAPGRYAGAGGAVLITRPVERAHRGSAELERGPLSSSLEHVSTLLGVLTAMALVFAGGSALVVHQLRVPAGPERVRVQGVELSNVEVLQLRDSEGHRVLAVRGQLSSAADPPPRVQLLLIDASGSPIGAPHFALPGRLGDAELAVDKLDALLSRAEPASGGDARGFTVLIRDPPLEAERFSLDLAG